MTPLLKKIRADLKSNLTGIWNCEEAMVNQLDPRYAESALGQLALSGSCLKEPFGAAPSYSKGIHTPGRHVRTRLYFTSESHIYSLLSVLKYGNLFEVCPSGLVSASRIRVSGLTGLLCAVLKDNSDEQWNTALSFLNTIPELEYLTQIVIMLYEDTSVVSVKDEVQPALSQVGPPLTLTFVRSFVRF